MLNNEKVGEIKYIDTTCLDYSEAIPYNDLLTKYGPEGIYAIANCLIRLANLDTDTGNNNG